LPKSRPTSELRDELSDLFWAITVFDEQSFDLLRVVHSKDTSKFDLAIGVLGSASGNLVLSHRNEMLETLQAAENDGGDRLERVIGALCLPPAPFFFVGLGKRVVALDHGPSHER